MEDYEDWLAEAPASYKDDGFLGRNFPITITSRYGQNQPLDDNEDQNSQWWDKFRSFSNIRYICMAIATDIG
jgi:hypothetical protein